MNTEDKALIAGIACSVLVHVGVAGALPWVPADRHLAVTVPEVEFSIEMPEVERAPEVVPPVPTRRREAPRPRMDDIRPEDLPPAALELGPVAPDQPVTELPPEELERRRRERRAALTDLSPEAIARAGLRLELPSGPRDVQDDGRRRSPGRGTAFYSERGSSLAAGIARDANRRAGGRRPPPELRRGTDGSYRWEGPLVSARIHPDGRVTFTDRPGVQMNGDGQVAGRFDLNDALSRSAGQDPYGAEKRWFLRETERLRDGLSEASHEETMAAAERQLRGRLRALWGNPSMPAANRRRQVFRVWDGLAEDEVGRRARSVIERFVRRAMPAGSPSGYTPAELAELNQSRRSTSRFEPYR